MSIGVSYFGNRILRHAAADMDDLAARGFTGVLHTMSENDLTYYRDTLGRLVEIYHAGGLFVQVGPWGVGRTFGGEAESLFVANHPHVGQVLDSGRPVASGCLNSDAYREFVRSWATAAVETGADRIFWDEPHWAHPSHFGEPGERWGCRCPRCVKRWCDETGDEDMPTELTAEVRAFREHCLVEFLGELTAYVAGLGGRSTVCLLPRTTGSMGVADWSAVARLPGVATLATDPYWQAFDEPAVPFVTEFSERVAQQAAAARIEAQICIQGFRLGPEDGDDIHAPVDAARPEGRIVYVGAGTAGRMGVLDAAECGPTFNAAETVIALMAGGPDALTTPKEGAEDDAAAGAAELGALGVGPADAVVGISASGRTPYVLGALGAARAAGALTVGLSCHPGSLASAAADHAVEVVVGPEVIAGSTRLKAGAAQKLVLNTISTVVMIRLGRTYGNLMVDVRAGSEKLVDRARRIVATATGRPPAEAAAALDAADGEVKTAIVALLAGVDPAAARQRLDRAGGVVRRALSAP